MGSLKWENICNWKQSFKSVKKLVLKALQLQSYKSSCSMYSYNVQSEIIKFHLRQIQVYIAVFFDVFEQLDIFLKTQERVQKIELKYVFLGNSPYA